MNDNKKEKLSQEFLEAYDNFSDAIFRHCAFRVWERDRARDITQETFLKTWGYLAKGNTIVNIRAFLYRVANNLIIDDARKRKPILSLELLAEEGFDLAGTGDKDIERAVTIRDLMGTLKTLPEEYRTILIMRYSDDLTPKEIGKILGKTENTISVRIHRAIKKIKTIRDATEAV